MAVENSYLTQSEAAKVSRLSPRTLERMRLVGGGPKFVKAGRRVLYRAVDLEAWLQERTFQSTSEAEQQSKAALPRRETP